MTESNLLEQKKRQVSRAYLGRHHIHGVGMNHEQQAIILYVDGGHSLEDSLLSELRREAEPFAIVVKESGRSTFAIE